MTDDEFPPRTPQYWLAGKPSEVDDAALEAYLQRGVWQSPTPKRHATLLSSMGAGDRIALKTTANRTTGLPFFNADQPVSTMTIHATGEVTGVDPESGTVSARWTALEPPREWYFLTYLDNLVRVDPDLFPTRRQLIDVVFGGAQQDYTHFLSDPFLADRYPLPTEFTWIPFYEEFATKLLRFRSDRAPLVDLLLEIGRREQFLSYLINDKNSAGETVPITDVDPFSVMGCFNRNVTDENRRRVAEAFRAALGLSAEAPADFDGIPVLNNQNSWFTLHSASRDERDVDRLWDVFAAAQALADAEDDDTRSAFVSAWDGAQLVKGVRWNVSQGLFWARPRDFVTLDGPSRTYIAHKFGLPEPVDGATYLELRDRLRSELVEPRTSITSFPLLSYAAWWDVTRVEVHHTLAGFATWAARLAEDVDLDGAVNDSERRTSALLAQAASEARADDQGWQQTFGKALSSTNTLDLSCQDDFKKAVLADPNGMRQVLSLVWDDPVPASLDRLQAGLAPHVARLRSGNAAALGAALLMAEDVEDNAPFSPSRTTKWYRCAGFTDPSDQTSATSRYSTMLGFLDALSDELAEHLGYSPTRLETQGLAWVATEHEIPESWRDVDRRALLEWRGNPVEPQRAWLVRAKTSAVPDWVEGSYVSMAARHLGEVPPGASQKAVKAAVEKGYQHVDYSQRQSLSEEYHAFLSVMKSGDLVATQSNTLLQIGVVVGDPEYFDGSDDRLRRAVDWRSAVPTDDVAAPLKGLLDLQGTVVDITVGLEVLTGILMLPPPGPGPQPQPPQPPPSMVPRLPAVSDRLAADVHTERGPLQEIVDLLQSRQQVVLYGPPGTGKTFLALALARHIVGPEDRSRVQLVQFHPSYAYEDFFEGYRPTETESGQATFELKPGPLRRIAADARENPQSPYVLVIDELNRANLAKVFGELYFLLEYRKESLQLQYQPSEAFQLPPNLFFIATMNTADRSIALLDAAMRRRFSFVELHPDEPPVRDLLANWLDANHQSRERALLLAALNEAIEEQDRDLRLGPSYLMRAEAGTEEGLARIWKYDIMPLLEEHYYGRLNRDQLRARFGLEALRADLARVAGAAAREGSSGDEGAAGAPGPRDDIGDPDDLPGAASP